MSVKTYICHGRISNSTGRKSNYQDKLGRKSNQSSIVRKFNVGDLGIVLGSEI